MVSEYITREKAAGAAGSYPSITLDNPIHQDVKIKSITIGCSAAFKFVKVRAVLFLGNVSQIVGLKWMVNLNEIGGWAGLKAHWKRDHQLNIRLMSQGVGTLFYTIEWEIFPEAEIEAKRRWW